MRFLLPSFGTALVLTTLAGSAAADTIQVGPTRAQKTLQDVQGILKPGDVVELDGGVTYPGGIYIRSAQNGTADQKVTIRGIKVGGKRPLISGGGTGILDGLGMVLNGSHYVLESLEVTGATNTCIIHKGDDITIRDFVVHDCPAQGLLGNDDEAGSLLLELSEFYGNGGGELHHQIYMATSEDMYPGSVFRMQHCYVHDGHGGNNVKSRAERNEIYYNWIESAYYHDVELIGPDKSPATPTREDSDVVGNVIIGNGSQNWHLVRVGGDKDEADTSGRYRFMNNTFVVGPGGAQSIVRAMLRVDTIEMHNNAIVRAGAGVAPLFSTSEVVWVNGPSIFGSNNWVQDGLTGTPATWTNTLTGPDASLVNVVGYDVRLKDGSPLVDKAVSNPASVAGREFPKPLAAPAFVPPSRVAELTPTARPTVGALDIGAFEIGSGTPAPPSSSGGAGGPNGDGTSGGPGGTSGTAGTSGTPGGAAPAGSGGSSGCGCGVIGTPALSAVAALALSGVAALVAALRRRDRSRR
jgi:hypothetical protein